eukprot:3729566-Rhodomonas_salina.4
MQHRHPLASACIGIKDPCRYRVVTQSVGSYQCVQWCQDTGRRMGIIQQEVASYAQAHIGSQTSKYAYPQDQRSHTTSTIRHSSQQPHLRVGGGFDRPEQHAVVAPYHKSVPDSA